jgi:hypothetical protein
MRIIDSDIDHYQAFVETHTMNLQRCHPDDESKHRALRDAAQKTLAALKEYRGVIDTKSGS